MEQRPAKAGSAGKPGCFAGSAVESLAPIGAQTELGDLEEQHDTINPRLNIIFKSESTERAEVE